MHRTFRRLAAALGTFALSAALLALLPGCNTVSGAGEDLEEASSNTEDAIEDM